MKDVIPPVLRGRGLLRALALATVVSSGGLMGAASPAGARAGVPEVSSGTTTATGDRAAGTAARPAAAARWAGTSASTTALDPALEPLRGVADPTAPYQGGRAALEITVDGAPVPYRVLAISASPGAALDLVAEPGTTLRHDAGEAAETGDGRWRWTAPEQPGIHALEVGRAADGARVHLNVLVTHPRAGVRDGSLNGYRIGRYREDPLGGRAAYLPPEGFVAVSPAEEDVLVSPHFTLGQFLCKQDGDPRYLALSTPLVLKLESLLEAVNREGFRAGSFHVMSGFRTPWYNRAIGNTTDYSRHLWGDAADIWIDADGDGEMDDLDGDGRSTIADAHVLASIVEKVEAGGDQTPGGLGSYRRNAAHGPFVHVDARGYAARW